MWKQNSMWPMYYDWDGVPCRGWNETTNILFIFFVDIVINFLSGEEKYHIMYAALCVPCASVSF